MIDGVSAIEYGVAATKFAEAFKTIFECFFLVWILWKFVPFFFRIIGWEVVDSGRIDNLERKVQMMSKGYKTRRS
jgi:hypothetical protein